MAIEWEPVEDPLLELVGLSSSEDDLEGTLLKVLELARRHAGADMASVTMLVEGNPTTAVYTDAEAPVIDRSQYETGSGPCLDAYRHQVVYRIDSTLDELRWPTFSRDAAAHGILSSLSIPINAGREGLGALNLYARRTGAFDEDSASELARFATHAGAVLANNGAYREMRHQSENLARAMDSRATIDIATGILMAGGGHSQEKAFQMLVSASQRENRKLRDIAAEIVERTARREDSIDPDVLA
jgi:transcriptional regulator with GAF, ATPase, and Fis domain